MRRGGYKTWLLPAIFVIAAGEFMLDLATPLGVSDWLLYFIPLLLSSYVGSRHFPYLLAGLFSMLNLAGFYLSASGGVNPNYAIIGRLIGIGAFWVTALIISRFKANEEKLRLTDRALKTISECDKALVRATSEPALLQEICRVIVEQGGYRLAWVGFAENDADKTVRFAARAGCDEGYLEQARITWADTERGRGPTGTAIRTGRIVACNNMLTDPLLAFWREAARQRGFHSSIVLPLQNAGKTFGVLTLYAGQINAFQSPEIELLKELTDDLAFGIHALRTRAEHQQAEQTLQESEQKYRSIFDQAQLGIFQSTLDGRLISVNDAAAVMAGFESPAAMVQATNDIAAQHFANSDQRPEIVQAACQSDKSVQRELEFRRRDGTPFPVSLHMRAVRGPNGEVKFLEGFVEDITWRREAEKRLRESEQKYRGIVEQSPLGIYQSTVDGRLTSVNPALVAIFGFASAEEMMLASDNLSAQRFVHAGQRQEIVRAACQSETSVQREVEYRRKDGTPFPANLHMRAIRGPAGEIIALEGYVEDISQRKQSELALQQTERSYREIFNAANDAIFIHDADTGAVLDVNESMLQLYGFSREEALRLTAEDGSQGISPYSAAEARQWMIKAINEGPQVFEWHSRKKSGELFWVEVALKHADIGGQRRFALKQIQA